MVTLRNRRIPSPEPEVSRNCPRSRIAPTQSVPMTTEPALVISGPEVERTPQKRRAWACVDQFDEKTIWLQAREIAPDAEVGVYKLSNFTSF